MTDKDKEELYNEFNRVCNENSKSGEFWDYVFDWFISVIEEREKLLIASGHEFSKALELEKEANKLLREKLEAAEKMIELMVHNDSNEWSQQDRALEHYKALKV